MFGIRLAIIDSVKQNENVSLLAMVMVSMFSTVSFAGNGVASQVVADVQMVSPQAKADVFGDYQPIEARELPAIIQFVIQKDFAGCSFREAAVETNVQGVKIYKVVLVNEDGVDTEVFFSEQGEVLN